MRTHHQTDSAPNDSTVYRHHDPTYCWKDYSTYYLTQDSPHKAPLSMARSELLSDGSDISFNTTNHLASSAACCVGSDTSRRTAARSSNSWAGAMVGDSLDMGSSTVTDSTLRGTRRSACGAPMQHQRLIVPSIRHRFRSGCEAVQFPERTAFNDRHRQIHRRQSCRDASWESPEAPHQTQATLATHQELSPAIQERPRRSAHHSQSWRRNWD